MMTDIVMDSWLNQFPPFYGGTMMSKQQFIQKQDVPREHAEKAWEVAEGDEDQAAQLLRDQSVWLKGQFTASDNPVTGYFILNYDFDESTSLFSKGVVLSSGQDVDVPLSDVYKRFRKNLDSIATHNKKMNANTQQLNSTMSSALEATDLETHLKSKNSDNAASTLETRFSQDFDFEIQSVRVQLEVERPVDSAQIPSRDSGQEPKEEEIVEIPCDVEITPVGIPVANLHPGDEIFVSIGDVERSQKNTKRQLEATADPEIGMVKARLESKKTSDVGTLRLKVKLSEGTIGKISCGQDVSIRVPSATKNAKDNARENDVLEFVQENWIALITIIIVVILLISLVVVLTM